MQKEIWLLGMLNRQQGNQILGGNGLRFQNPSFPPCMAPSFNTSNLPSVTINAIGVLTGILWSTLQRVRLGLEGPVLSGMALPRSARAATLGPAPLC